MTCGICGKNSMFSFISRQLRGNFIDTIHVISFNITRGYFNFTDSTFHYKCKKGSCWGNSIVGNAIYGNSDDVADACSRDHPRCKAYQYSSKNGREGQGSLCSSINKGYKGIISGSYQYCEKIEGMTNEIGNTYKNFLRYNTIWFAMNKLFKYVFQRHF